MGEFARMTHTSHNVVVLELIRYDDAQDVVSLEIAQANNVNNISNQLGPIRDDSTGADNIFRDQKRYAAEYATHLSRQKHDFEDRQGSCERHQRMRGLSLDEQPRMRRANGRFPQFR